MQALRQLGPRALLISSIVCLCMTGAQAKNATDVFVVGPDPLPVEIVPSSSGRTAACALYDDSRFFQHNTIFNEDAFSYDTLLRTDNVGDSFVVTRVVVTMLGESRDIGSIVLSFNSAGATIDPGISIDPPSSGNLGIKFAPSHQFVSGFSSRAIFDPNWIFNFSTSLRVLLIDTGGANMGARQASVAIQGCLLSPTTP